ncbi:MAG: HAMP domain-containing protein [Nitrospirae bacterium]|nr:HAMP domain-containing protein [Nitrospirota bacterium]
MKKLQNKILASFLPVVIIPLITVIIACIAVLERQVYESSNTMLTNSVKGAETEFKFIEKDLLTSAHSIALEEDIVNMAKFKDRKALLGLLPKIKTMIGVDIIRVISPEGLVLAEGYYTTPYKKTGLLFRKMLARALQGEDVTTIGKSDLGITLEAFVQIRADNKPVGILELALLMDYELLSKLKDKYGLDSVVFSYGLPQAITFTDSEIIMDTNLKKLVDEVETGQKQILKEMTLGGSRYYVIAKPIEFEKVILGVLLFASSSEQAFRTRKTLEITLLISIVALVLITLFMSRRVSLRIVQPIGMLSRITREIAEGTLIGEVEVKSDDEIRQLADSFNKMIEELRKHREHLEKLVSERTGDLIKVNEELEKEIAVRTKVEEQLQYLNVNLEKKVDDEVNQRRQQEQMLIQQSKMAAMGEMIGAIAHQWRQPLNALGLIVQDIEDAYKFGELDDGYISDAVSNAMAQIDFMSRTIDDFRNFFRSDKTKTTFDVKEATNKVLSMFLAQLNTNFISCRLICHIHEKTFESLSEVLCCDEMQVTTYKNEFEQVILNIINNARDAILSNRRKRLLPAQGEGLISIDFYKEAHNESTAVVIKISDNGGGIPPNIIDRIFEPYFTTKELAKGTGIGLYMSKTIIENNMGGSLTAKNVEAGAEFTIKINTY